MANKAHKKRRAISFARIKDSLCYTSLSLSLSLSLDLDLDLDLEAWGRGGCGESSPHATEIDLIW